VPRKRIEQLRLKRGPSAPRVKVGEERVLRLVEDNGRVQPRAQAVGERGLPPAGGRIEMADLKERVRKLEAIAAGIDI
jgi:hypothetical protein